MEPPPREGKGNPTLLDCPCSCPAIWLFLAGACCCPGGCCRQKALLCSTGLSHTSHGAQRKRSCLQTLSPVHLMNLFIPFPLPMEGGLFFFFEPWVYSLGGPLCDYSGVMWAKGYLRKMGRWYGQWG